MTEETRPGFLANYKIVRPGPARPAFGPARLTPLLYKMEQAAAAIEGVLDPKNPDAAQRFLRLLHIPRKVNSIPPLYFREFVTCSLAYTVLVQYIQRT